MAGRGIIPRVLLTGQHPHLRPADHRLDEYPLADLGCAGQPNPHLHVGLVARRLPPAVADVGLVVVQGDTSSALGGALGAAAVGIPVAHVEAGLRSHDRGNPWPEEDFRIAIDGMADLLFAPTELNAANLRRERVSGSITVTGNTGIDALIGKMPTQFGAPYRQRRHLLVTCHRRESWGEGLQSIAAALHRLADRGDLDISMLLHPNPRVSDEMRRLVGGRTQIRLEAPCDHPEMLRRMQCADLILSDSGGIQEEAPVLGIPLLVLRERTERPEGILSGNAVLVGRDPRRIVATVERLLTDEGALVQMARRSLPYGDGHSADRISAVIADWLENHSADGSVAAAAA